MKNLLPLGLAIGLLCGLASAGEIELAAYAGPALPTYEQRFRYDPGAIPLPPGISVQQEGVFGLDAKGGIAFGGSLTWYFAKAIGVEARVDSAGVDVQSQAAQFSVDLRLPSPLPPVGVRLEPTGTVELDRLTPISLNIKLRTPGRVRFVLSAGASWLPSVSFSATETIGLGVTGLGGPTGVIVPTLPLQAGGEIEQAFGVNAGVGFQVAVARKVSLVAEGRFFSFPERSLEWGRADNRLLSAVEQALVQEIERRLGPVEFSPRFFQATAGLAVRF